MIEFKNVSHGPLENLSFKIEQNDRAILFGPSGAGKSTMLFLFNRLKDPEQGEIFYKGKPIEEVPITTLRQKVGLLLQSPNLFPGTVLDNLKYGPSLTNSWEPGAEEKLLEYVQLPLDIKDRDVDHLSGGQQQRVSLARTLANEPEVLLLDEPTSALDNKTAEDIEHVLKELIEAHNLTMVMVTHQMDQARRLGTKGLFMHEGRIQETGELPGMLDDPKTKELKEYLQE
ncbi:ABC transporter ATP-binding protein [Salimicrobium halophilum]|uniref:Phosphate ABC transporter ATP-binding protein, PhoT family n=1 Tax=Salimicrobium halophilum TaxID=86666 RepID=A0A1G8PSQ1_9BACI|nr:phosphate ABC transporter ATP-binding protein [Salimicrobium halophilum]SDI95501.1 phosphate ABC transporter ATP-binding protein, PhoT family [Salimicrobium halophilum]